MCERKYYYAYLHNVNVIIRLQYSFSLLGIGIGEICTHSNCYATSHPIPFLSKEDNIRVGNLVSGNH